MPRLDETQLESLAMTAWEARLNAYAPYSQFAVGAALIAADGRVFCGANVENASLGLTICAERTAIAAAVTAGVRAIAAIAVAGGGPEGVLPCGACRQMLAEFSHNVLILRCHADGSYEKHNLPELLPAAFTRFGATEDDGTRRKLELAALS